jgi:hypothetical protein
MENLLIISFKKNGGGAENVINNLVNFNCYGKYRIKTLFKDDFSDNNRLKFLNLVLFFFEIIKLSRSCKYVISGIEGAPFLLCFFALSIISESSKLILWLHCEPRNYVKYTNLKNKFYISLSIYLSKNIICASPVAKVNMQSKGKNAFFLKNFIDQEQLSTFSKKLEFRSRLKSFDLLFIGSLAELKRPIILLSLYKYLNLHKLNIGKLHYFGNGPLMGPLIKSIEAANLKGNVILHGHVRNPWDCINSNHILLLPSLTEAMPMVVIEALGRGVTVLCNSFPGSEFFELDNSLFFITDFSDFDSVLIAIQKVIGFSDHELQTRRTTSLNFINNNFNNLSNFDELSYFLDSIQFDQ